MTNHNLMRRCAFLRGFRYGSTYSKHISTREAEEMNPDLNAEEIEVFLNGVDDGVYGDEFRKNIA